MWADVAIIVGAYIFGSLPHLHWMAKLRGIDLGGDFHQDLWNRGGKIPGILGVVGEFVKGAVPVLVARVLDFDITIVAIVGLVAVCGQMWPVFNSFDGEKGNSIAIAMSITLVPVPALIAVTYVVIAVIIRTTPRLLVRFKSKSGTAIIGGSYSRALPLGMLACFLTLPFLVWGFGEPAPLIWCCAILFVLIIVRRLTAGLGRDLKSDNNVGAVVIRRLLYDRATVSWRE